MGSQNSDEELVELASQGRLDAFDALYDRHQDRVFNLLIRMCGSEEDAEDLSQKTFVNAWNAFATFRKGSRFYTWLYRIALNAVYTHERDKMRRRKYEAGSLDAPAAGSDDERHSMGSGVADKRSEDPLETFLNKERDAMIQNALNRLGTDYREILILRDIDDLDYDTIAETLSISLAAVKSRLHRARKEMAVLLKDL